MPSMSQSAPETKAIDATDRVEPAQRRFEDLPPAAQRALEEAAERRAAAATEADRELPAEIAGRQGPEPVRYGDWEKNGLISDF